MASRENQELNPLVQKKCPPLMCRKYLNAPEAKSEFYGLLNSRLLSRRMAGHHQLFVYNSNLRRESLKKYKDFRNLWKWGKKRVLVDGLFQKRSVFTTNLRDPHNISTTIICDAWYSFGEKYCVTSGYMSIEWQWIV